MYKNGNNKILNINISNENNKELNYDSEANPKVWYTHYKGNIVKSVLDSNNRIHEKAIQYNQPSEFRNFLNNYFSNKLN